MNPVFNPPLAAHADYCRCTELQGQLDRLAIEAERIEMLTEGAVELLVPTIDRPLFGDRRRVIVLLTAVADPCEIDADLASHTAAELRRTADQFRAAADLIEKGGA